MSMKNVATMMHYKKLLH